MSEKNQTPLKVLMTAQQQSQHSVSMSVFIASVGNYQQRGTPKLLVDSLAVAQLVDQLSLNLRANGSSCLLGWEDLPVLAEDTETP